MPYTAAVFVFSKRLHGGLGVKHVYFLEVVKQVFPLVRPQYTQRQADKRPQMNHPVMPAIVFAQFVNLRVAIVASGNAVSGARGLDLLVLESAVRQALVLVSGLQKPAAAAAAVIIGAVGGHVNKIFFANHGFDNIAEIFGNGITVAFSDNLAGILDRKLDFQVLVPVGVDLQLSFPDPFGIVFVNVFNFKLMVDVEFFQSGPDCKSNVPSLGVEVRLAPQLMCLVGGDRHQMLPCVIVCKKHAVVFTGPSL
mgnify:CR=1 FL=1